jgi:predicted O-methyltransferase YrrM
MKLPLSTYFKSSKPYTDENYFPSLLLQKIYTTWRLEYEENGKIKEKELGSHVSPLEGFYMYDLIKLNNYKNCLEVGMANGISALYICQALLETSGRGKGNLISIDPYQSTQWKSIGMRNIKNAGLSAFHTLMEDKSLFAMPELIGEVYAGKREPFDFIFIDGMHLYDYTLVDFICASLLLRVGGVIIIDDYRHKAVTDVCNYLDKNYLHYKIHADIPIKTVRMYEKIGEDDRVWYFHDSPCNVKVKPVFAN